VIGAEHGGPQSVAAETAMPALQPRDRRAAKGARGRRRQRLDDAGVRALGGRQPAGDGFRLSVIRAAVHLLERVDARQYESRAETARQPGKRARPEARPQARHALPHRADLAFPELGMCVLDRREASINLRQFRVLLGLRQRAVKRRAVDLSLQVGPVALPRIFLVHLRFSLAAAGKPYRLTSLPGFMMLAG